MKNLFIALVTASILLSGCIPTKEQETKPDQTQPQNQQPIAETKVFHVAPEAVSMIHVPIVLGSPQITPTLTSREAPPEETANIIKWYNSITEYKLNTSWPQGGGIGPDVGIDMYEKRKGQDMVFVQIGLYRDRLLADGRDGQAYWVEQTELEVYLKKAR